MPLTKFLKRTLLIIFTIWIYLILSITVYQNYQERKMYQVIYDYLASWKPGQISESSRVVTREKNLTTELDPELAKRLSGQILLQVEENGEAWYVNPADRMRYYLGRPQDAFSLIKNFGQTTKHADIDKYLGAKFPANLAGRILIDADTAEAYYIHPQELRGYYLAQPLDTLRIMKDLGMGIKDEELRKIEVGDLL